MAKPKAQLSLFEELPNVRKPATTISRPVDAEECTLTATVTDTVLEPVEDPKIPTLLPATSHVEIASITLPADALVTTEDDLRTQGQLEAEESRRRNERALRYEDRSNENARAFLKFGVFYILAKAGIPVYHFVLAKLDAPQTDGTLISAAIGVACAWHYSQYISYALLAREHTYQYDLKFSQMSLIGKFAKSIQVATELANFALFAFVLVSAFLDIVSVATFTIEYWRWLNGMTVTVPK